MGCFDKLVVNCPGCGHRVLFQSKADDCSMSEYTLSDVPASIAGDLHGATEECHECGTTVRIRTQVFTIVERIS